MSTVKGRQAFTLIEVLLVAALMLLLMTLAMQVFMPMFKGGQRGAQQMELQQTAILLMSRLAVEIGQVSPNSLAILPPGAGELPIRIALRPMLAVGAGGGQNFSPTEICYWYDPSVSAVWRLECPGQNGVVFSSTDFDNLLQNLPGGARILANNVVSMNATMLSTPGPQPSVTGATISLRLQAPFSPDGGPKEHYELARDIALRNLDYH
jgi:prepilin-type N-terminal cleavage/methylation domain-containing protein